MTADRLIAGRYRLTDPIGSGAMGVVWRGTDVRLRRTVAVKQLLLAPNLSRSQALEAKLRAMREGRIAARLHHPNAITVFDVAEEDGQPWLVMEYMDAPSLAVKLSDKGTLAPTEVARIGAQAAGALAAAHEAGIMHRDVKPANLLVAADGTVKITDFGISRAVGDVTVTATGFLAGTPAYLAPEVARGEDPEAASDVFALGSTLYAAVEGTPPFGEGDNPLAVLHAVARAEVPQPRHAGALGPVLMRLLAATIDARPTMREAQKALEDVAAGRVPALASAPLMTKVLPAPGGDAGATTVLATPGTGVPIGNYSDATEFVPTTAAATGSPTPPPPGRPGGTLPGGTGAGGPNKQVIGLVAAAVVAALVVITVVLAAQSRDEGGQTAAPPAVTDSATGAPPTSSETDTGPVQQEPQAPVAVSSTASAPSTAAPSTTAPSTSAPNSTVTSTAASSSTASSSATSSVPGSTTRPPTTTVTTTPFGPPTAERVTSFIQGYYGMLPGNVSGAWSQLAPSYQAQTGGYNAYASFWSSIRSVRVNSITPSGNDAATASLTYVKTDGTTTTENRWFQVAADGSRLLITASSA
ncbi:serine/threonine-protein kinase [Nocardia sp. NPDC050710]|uniref:serine/threonine-protein kinase n=1 Tax=Nocardia sp. NPDC050710 TaxID=3157220 RepID=UPI00340E388F